MMPVEMGGENTSCFSYPLFSFDAPPSTRFHSFSTVPTCLFHSLPLSALELLKSHNLFLSNSRFGLSRSTPEGRPVPVRFSALKVKTVNTTSGHPLVVSFFLGGSCTGRTLNRCRWPWGLASSESAA